MNSFTEYKAFSEWTKGEEASVWESQVCCSGLAAHITNQHHHLFSYLPHLHGLDPELQLATHCGGITHHHSYNHPPHPHCTFSHLLTIMAETSPPLRLTTSPPQYSTLSPSQMTFTLIPYLHTYPNCHHSTTTPQPLLIVLSPTLPFHHCINAHLRIHCHCINACVSSTLWHCNELTLLYAAHSTNKRAHFCWCYI